MLNSNLFFVVIGVILTVVIYLAILAAKKGVPAAIAKIKSWWNKGTVAAEALEKRLQAIEGDIVTLKSKFGISTPPVSPASPLPGPAAGPATPPAS